MGFVQCCTVHIAVFGFALIILGYFSARENNIVYCRGGNKIHKNTHNLCFC